MKRLLLVFPATTIYLLTGTAILFVVLFLSTVNNINAQSDTAAPQLMSFDFSPRTINTSYSQTITVTLRAADNLTGVQSGIVAFDGPGPFASSAAFNSSHRISGDERDGIYQFQMLVTTNQSAVGTWHVININLTDTAGNVKNYSQSELSGLGFSVDLEVTHDLDFTPPVLQSFSFSPASISTGSASQIVTATARITDDLSGFNQAGSVRFVSPSGQQSVSKSFSGSRISGDARDGIYEVHLVFPQNSEPGVWRAASVVIPDFEINVNIYSTDNLTALGFPVSLQVISAPTSVSFTGQLTSASGRGVFLARVAITDKQGITRTTLTNPFGFYRFANVPIGETYVFNITSKRYQFSPQSYTITEQTTEVNFTANN